MIDNMVKLFQALVLGGILVSPAVAFKNPIDDVRENLVWTVGKTAEVGQAVKLWGGGDLDNGEWTTSFLAGIAEYRWLVLSGGGTMVNETRTIREDTFKVGLKLNKFFELFKNPPTSEMAWMKNINIGPSFATSLFTTPQVGKVFLDINYQFGGGR